MGKLYDYFGERSEWFALYASDTLINDEMFCSEVKRGNFRLHPKVGRGLSKGCITIDSQADFRAIRARLISVKKLSIPNTALMTYGKVTVK